ncbi:hypothetical protein GF340_05850 [Candidatus Peregrinibacteria bacterium]|nr:hypothetical protein [Candidatus Peregrinibacteria bacterium]
MQTKWYRQAGMQALLLAALLSALVSGGLQAQQLSVELNADKRQVDINGQVVLTVNISGQMNNLPQPRLENIGPFEVHRSGTNSQISMVNGRITASLRVNYILTPSRDGTFTVGPATVEAGGERYSSGTVDIAVTPAGSAQPATGGGGAQPQGNNAQQPQQASPSAGAAGGGASAHDGNIFIRHSVNKQEVYLGEQLIYTFGYYNRLRNIDNPNYTPATFTGFWAEEIDKQARHATREVRGRMYQVQELRTALFPTVAGEATVSPARLTYQYRNVWDFFERGRSGTLTTKPITVSVKPLPERGRPGNFKGAVGRYSTSIKADRTTVDQGEAITLEYTVSGTGNISTLPEVTIPGLDEFDIYESQSEEHIDRGGGKISGRKVYTFVIVPRRAGNYTVPPVEFSYFDPEAEQYRTLRSEPVHFEVKPSGDGQQPPVTYRMSPEKVMAVGEDIRYIKEDAGEVLPADDRAEGEGRSVFFWLSHLVPLIAVALSLAWRRHRGRLMSDTGYARLRGAGRKLDRTLKQAGKSVAAGDYTAGYAAMDRALNHFIGDKLNVETAGMLSDQVELLLAARDVDSSLREQVRECLDHFSYVRFAPQSGADRDTAMRYLKKVRKLCGQLDRAI